MPGTVAISQPDQHGAITVTTDAYAIRVQPRHHYERMHPAVYVADTVSEAAEPELGRLAEQEANLGELRWCPSVREGGSHPEVDALYVALNERIAATKTAIAKQALTLLGDVVAGDLAHGAENAYFSRKAGCDMCPCSPGVVVPTVLRIGKDMVDIWIEPVA
jgi:hypothetical protein